jgi:AAA+ superfamily predicted ATPase
LQSRLKRLPHAQRDSIELLLEDFEGTSFEEVSVESLFAEIVGCEQVHAAIRGLENTIAQCERQGIDPRTKCGFNYVFTGSPGTGKTTVARLMGKIFHKHGLIASEDVIEVSPTDFTTGFAGQSGKATHSVLSRALGKVLFIDEAYGLGGGDVFMTEVVTELVKSLTSIEFKDKLVVIMAGYQKAMDSMLDSNQGLRSRFTERVHFEDFTPALVEQLVCQKVASDGMEMSDASLDCLGDIAERMKAAPNFANGKIS